jgi:tripartite ATP-independent transporter DctM subunit
LKSSAEGKQVHPVFQALRQAENLLAYLVLVLLALIPTLEVIVRKLFQTGIPGSTLYVMHLVLWITFVGGMITSREGRHLSLSLGIERLQAPVGRTIRIATHWISVAIGTVLTWSSFSLLLIGFDPSKTVGLFPIQAVVLVMPAGFAVMTLRFILAADGRPSRRLLAATGVLAGSFLAIESLASAADALLGQAPDFLWTLVDRIAPAAEAMVWPGVAVLMVTALLGTPLFIALGGITVLLFLRSGGVLAVIPNEAYTMLTGPAIPAIPLFTLAGFILSESKAGERLVRLFRAFFGWLPGGLAIVAVLVCTFFTTFTGASGVTILALGALLVYILVESGGYSRSFSTGLITASGSVGLLFPPSLPVILYGVVAQINIKHLFIGGFLPGALMVLTLVVLGVIAARRRQVEPIPFRLPEAWATFRESIWEILLPVIILLGFFLGITTLVETGAIAVVYVLIVQILVHRDLAIGDLPRVFLKCIPIIGGVLIILAIAKGLSYYIVDVEVPVHLTNWVRGHISSKLVFLLLLNLALLVTGCLMDIFSAIIVVVPLIVPLSEVFGIHPVHLGIIFLANLELGYITPPVGLNLYLASYRFEQPLVKVYRNVVYFLWVRLVTVLLITYVPLFSLGLLRILRV